MLHCDVWYTNQRRSFREKCFLAPLHFLHGRWRLLSICHINRHVFFNTMFFFHNSINFSSNSSLQNSISRQTRKNTSHMTSWPTNWVNWVTTFRTDRWQLFTTTRRPSCWIELRRRRYRNFADATQLKSTSSWVELCRYKRAFSKSCLSQPSWTTTTKRREENRI